MIICRPIGFASLFTLIFVGIGLLTIETLPHVAFDQFTLKQLFYSFGKFRGFCNVSRQLNLYSDKHNLRLRLYTKKKCTHPF
jgi:hypothetical protein